MEDEIEKTNDTKTAIKKKLFLEAYESKDGNVSSACKVAEIARCTYYRWIDEDPEFKQAAEDAWEAVIDRVETNLMDNIQSKDTTAQIFFLKTKGRNRGWVEKQDITQKIEVTSYTEKLKEIIDNVEEVG